VNVGRRREEGRGRREEGRGKREEERGRRDGNVVDEVLLLIQKRPTIH